MSSPKIDNWLADIVTVGRADLMAGITNSVGPTVGLYTMLSLAWESEVRKAHGDDVEGIGFACRPKGTPYVHPVKIFNELVEKLAAS